MKKKKIKIHNMHRMIIKITIEKSLNILKVYFFEWFVDSLKKNVMLCMFYNRNVRKLTDSFNVLHSFTRFKWI